MKSVTANGRNRCPSTKPSLSDDTFSLLARYVIRTCDLKLLSASAMNAILALTVDDASSVDLLVCTLAISA